MLILDKLWNGNVELGERRYHPSSEYNKRMCKREDYEKKVKAELSEAGKLAFDNFADAQLAVGVVCEGDKFIDGFRMGAMLMLDVLYPNRSQKEDAL